jgi:hypothetical protein
MPVSCRRRSCSTTTKMKSSLGRRREADCGADAGPHRPRQGNLPRGSVPRAL